MKEEKKEKREIYWIIQYNTYLACCYLHNVSVGLIPLNDITFSNEWPDYDTKQSDGEVPVMLGLWGMQNTASLLLLSGPFWLGIEAPDRVLSQG